MRNVDTKDKKGRCEASSFFYESSGVAKQIGLVWVCEVLVLGMTNETKNQTDSSICAM